MAILSASPDQSWQTYLGLHPSLRRYIPDDLFRSLLAHQLSNSHAKQSWVRALALIKFAKKCGVEARNLGLENLRNALRSGFDLILRTKVSDLKLYMGDIKGLWNQLKESEKEVPLDLKRGYLQLHIKQPLHKKWQRSSRAAVALKEVVGAYGCRGVEREAGKIVSLYDGDDETIHLESLRLAAWCADNGLQPFDDSFLVMLRLYEIWKGTDTGLDTLPKLQTMINGIESSPAGHEFLQSVFTHIRHRYRSPVMRTIDAMAQADKITVPSLTRETLSELATSDGNLSTAMDSLTVLLQKGGEAGAVVTAILDRLNRHQPPAIIHRLTRLLLEHDALPQLSAYHFNAIISLLISTLPSEDGYILCRKVYSAARNQGFRWSTQHRRHWHRLFHHAVHRTRRHLHFASRLYADLQADGQPVHRNDLLALIRSVGLSRSSSRSILLERHIRDFTDLDSRTRVSPDPFVLAMVEGLTAGKDAKDASLAFDLTRRILQDGPIPKTAADLMITRLAQSPNLYHLRQAVHLLDYSPTATSFNNVIFSIVAHSRLEQRAGQMSRSEALSQAVNVYKRMVSQDISATSRTVSLLLRALLDARHTESAINVFNATISNGLVLKPNAVGRLMVRLILDERLDEAAQIETKWRSITPTIAGRGSTYDKAIVGARVLLDMKRGIEVNLDEVAKKTGWKGTIPFLKFLESLKPRPEIINASVADAQFENSIIPGTDYHVNDLGAGNETHRVRPAVMNPDQPRRPWIRSDNERQRGFDTDSTVVVRSGIMT